MSRTSEKSMILYVFFELYLSLKSLRTDNVILSVEL